MILKIGINNLDKTLLDKINKIEVPQLKIKIKSNKDNLMAGPEILEVIIFGVASSAIWDILKVLFNKFYEYNIKMDPTNTDLDKIGGIYFGCPVYIINQGNNSVLICSEKSSKKLKFKENFEYVEGE